MKKVARALLCVGVLFLSFGNAYSRIDICAEIENQLWGCAFDPNCSWEEMNYWAELAIAGDCLE